LQNISKKITKRTILSLTAQIFDPLGLVGPIIMKAKIIIQKLWSLQLGWDLHTLWNKFTYQLNLLHQLTIPRKVITFFPHELIEFHGFSDASQQGYGAAVYVRVKSTENTYETHLLCAKSRVAPLKTITLPRLKLCGALLLARLFEKVKQSVNLHNARKIFWTDSSIVLAWIKTPPHLLKTFVANRVTEITSLTAASKWRHISGKVNPADILSRGAFPEEIVNNHLWFSGPEFLKLDECMWPKSDRINNIVQNGPETRVAMLTTTRKILPEMPVLTKYSDLNKLQRVMAWVLRFIHNANPKTGNLPAHRVQPGRPFQTCGVDYAGPVLIRESRGRGKRALLKSYIAIFVCFTTKAIHIELVTELTTAEFLAALRRFVARRGLPQNIYSDNATNFVGANNELIELKNFFEHKQFKNQVMNQLVNMSIKWHFIPPRSPHMGGLWEINVKSVKQHLKKNLGETKLTYSEMYTVLVQIEACLSSRPLIPISNDPNDLEPLTPGHFLVGESLTSIPEYDVSDVPMNRLSRWQLVEQLRSHFWKRWHREYLTQLQQRSKPKGTKNTPMEIGTMVLMMEDNAPSLSWNLGRVIELHPGDDGVTRVVTVRTNQGDFKRTARRLCVLPLEK
jgi:hypothetical protein